MLAINGKRFLTLLMAALVIGGLLVFVIMRFVPLLRGPVITLDSPAPGNVYAESAVSISGTARNTTSLTINGALVFIDTDGRFEELLLLQPGYTIISIHALDRFKKARTIEIPVFRDAPEPNLALPPRGPRPAPSPTEETSDDSADFEETEVLPA